MDVYFDNWRLAFRIQEAENACTNHVILIGRLEAIYLRL